MRSIKHFITHPKDILLVLLTRTANFWSDGTYLKLRYRIEMGQKLNLKEPQTFNEKLQWLKLYDRNPKYTTMVDKYEVKDYVGKLLGKDYIIPLIGVWDKVDEIKFDELPQQFVLKTTHGGGGVGVIVCKDKSKLDIEDVKRKLNTSLKADIYKYYREWPYKNVPRRILAEKYMMDDSGYELKDYKIFCFNGEPKYIQVDFDRYAETGHRKNLYNTDWELQDFQFNYPSDSSRKIGRPEKLDEMLGAARMLAKGTTFVRVDLYSIVSKIYFGELTFYPASGFGKFTPQEWSNKFGELLQLIDNKTNTIKKRGGVDI